MPTKKVKKVQDSAEYEKFVKRLRANSPVILNTEGLAIFVAAGTGRHVKTQRGLREKIKRLEKKIAAQTILACNEIHADMQQHDDVVEQLKKTKTEMENRLQIINQNRELIKKLQSELHIPDKEYKDNLTDPLTMKFDRLEFWSKSSLQWKECKIEDVFVLAILPHVSIMGKYSTCGLNMCVVIARDAAENIEGVIADINNSYFVEPIGHTIVYLLGDHSMKVPMDIHGGNGWRASSHYGKETCCYFGNIHPELFGETTFGRAYKATAQEFDKMLQRPLRQIKT